MSPTKPSMKRLLSTIAIAGTLIGFPVVSLAQTLPGLVLFGGPRSESRLSYRLDFGGRANAPGERYRLRVPAKKLNLAVAQFAITYPDYFDGKFDRKSIDVRVKGKNIPLQEVKWDEENHVIEIYPQEPIPANSSVEIVLSNVKNPPFGGVYYFNCQVLSPGDAPLLRYIGTWVLSIT